MTNTDASSPGVVIHLFIKPLSLSLCFSRHGYQLYFHILRIGSKKFPDFEALARATEEEVLKAWEGLGYYSRARNLHKLAKIAATWEAPPETPKEWKELPGVGPYIAAAVTSIALGKAEAVCDGNLVRVLSRIFAIDEEYKDGATAQKKIQPIAQSLIHSKRPGDYNQAMMELGATVCHRQSPLCLTCPVLKFCNSGQKGDAEKFPKLQKKKNKKKSIQRYWVEFNSELLLFTDLHSKNKLSGIYELPQEVPACIKQKSIESPIDWHPKTDHWKC